MATTQPTPSRRDLVRVGGAAVGLGAAALALGACGDSDSDGASAQGAGAATTTKADGGQSSGTVVTALSDVPVGGAVVKKIGEQVIVVAQPEAGQVKGFNGLCTHKGCPVVVLQGTTTLDCPCHHSNFDGLTGAVTKGPATTDLPPVALAVQGADVVTA